MKASTRLKLARRWVMALASGFGLAACGLSDRVAGTSSGVDNPQLTIAFTDSTGANARVTGSLSLYGAAQNPAVNAEPLASIRIDNNAFVNLSGLDLERSLPNHLSSGLTGTLAKAAASDMGVAVADTVVHFNVFVRTDGKQGAISLGLSYDTRLHRFTGAGDSPITQVSLAPRPLRRVEAVLDRKDSADGLDRVFIPGTPFVAVLVDSSFVFDEVPEGQYPLKLLTGDGRLFDVREPLDPRAPGRFTCDKGDGRPLPDTTQTQPDFKVRIRADSTAFIPAGSFLEAHVEGAAEGDARVTWLWRLIEGVDTNAFIFSPTQPKTKVVYRAPGLYTFEVLASLGTVTRRDTARIVVEEVTLPENRFIAPGDGQVVMLGWGFKLVWYTVFEGDVRLTLDTGGQIRVIEEKYRTHPGINEYVWFVPFDLPDNRLASLSLTDTTGAVIIRSGNFLLKRPPPPR